MTAKLSQWNPIITEPSLLMFYAKRNSGKTTAIKDILIRNRLQDKFDKVIAICPTDFDKDYVQSGAADVSLQEYNPIIIERLINNCKRHIETTAQKPRMALVLDDCLELISWHADKTLQSIATTGRHYGITLFIATQKPTGLPIVFRRNADFAIIFRQVSQDNVRMLTDEYNTFRQPRTFVNMLQGEETSNYGMLVIDDKDERGRYKLYRANFDEGKQLLIAKRKERTSASEVGVVRNQLLARFRIQVPVKAVKHTQKEAKKNNSGKRVHCFYAYMQIAPKVIEGCM